MRGTKRIRRAAARRGVLACMGVVGLAGSLVPVAGAGALGAHSAPASKTLVTYRLDYGEPYITYRVLTSGRAVIVDQEKPAVYHFTLSRRELGALKASIARAHVQTLRSHYSNTGPPILCGTPFQTLIVDGRTITLDSGPPPNEPPQLHQLLQRLIDKLDSEDPATRRAKDIARIAQRCIAGARA
jgi:hypothetical protein